MLLRLVDRDAETGFLPFELESERLHLKERGRRIAQVAVFWRDVYRWKASLLTIDANTLRRALLAILEMEMGAASAERRRLLEAAFRDLSHLEEVADELGGSNVWNSDEQQFVVRPEVEAKQRKLIRKHAYALGRSRRGRAERLPELVKAAERRIKRERAEAGQSADQLDRELVSEDLPRQVRQLRSRSKERRDRPSQPDHSQPYEYRELRVADVGGA